MCDLPASILQLHQQLGIPPGYGSDRGLHCFDTPLDLVPIGRDVAGRSQWLRRDAAQAWKSMVQVAKSEDILLQVVSAYRPVAYQAQLIQTCLARGETLKAVLNRIAAPGFSEHQSGRALDVTTPGYVAVEEEFESSDAFRWLRHNGHTFKFQLSYPLNNAEGFIYEPWHWCYRPD